MSPGKNGVGLERIGSELKERLAYLHSEEKLWKPSVLSNEPILI